MAENDNVYGHLFSHPEMVADLIRFCFREPWLQSLDFSTLEKVAGSYLSPEHRGEADDALWRIRWGQDFWLYVYLLMGTRSAFGPLTVAQLMTCLGGLYQDLARRQELTSKGKLPPVLPLVLFEGGPNSEAPQDVLELIEEIPGGLQQLHPRLRCCFLDASRFYTSDLEPIQNLTQGLIQLEKSRSPEDVERALAAPVWWLREKDRDSLRQAFSTFIAEVLLPERFPEITIPRGADLEEIKLLVGEYARRQEGPEEGCEEFREVLLRELESRHGPLPDEIRQRIAAIDSIEDLTRLSLRAGSISSLADLKLS